VDAGSVIRCRVHGNAVSMSVAQLVASSAFFVGAPLLIYILRTL
jgi:hypothetical protein